MEAIYMSPGEAAQRYNISRGFVYKMLELNECPGTLKVGAKRLLPIKAWDEFMESFFSDGKTNVQQFQPRVVGEEG